MYGFNELAQETISGAVEISSDFFANALRKKIIEDYIEKSGIDGEFAPKIGVYHVSELVPNTFCAPKVYHRRELEREDIIRESTRRREKYMSIPEVYGSNVLAYRGTILHNELIRVIADTYSLRSEIRLKHRVKSKYLDEDILILGKADLYDEKQRIVYDLKSVRPYAMKRYVEEKTPETPYVRYVKDSLPYMNHVYQVNAYAILLSARSYQIIYIDASDFTVARMFSLTPSDKMFQEIIDNASLIHYMEETGGKFPEKFRFMLPAEFVCKTCPLLSICELTKFGRK